MGMPLFPRTIVPFYSLRFALSYSWSTVEATDLNTREGKTKLSQLHLPVSNVAIEMHSRIH